MINLFVAYDENTWKTSPATLDKSRCLTEYILPEYKAAFGFLTADAIENIKRIPCLFAVENHVHERVYVGRIERISVRQRDVRIRFSLTGDYIDYDDYRNMESILDMSPLEFSRTHWTIKDADIEELQPYMKKNVIEIDPAKERVLFPPREETRSLHLIPASESYFNPHDIFGHLDTTAEKPQVFISYCWQPVDHKEKVLQLIKRLVNDCVDVIYDGNSLQPGQDMNYFMEKMVLGSQFSSIIVVCNEEYAKKADARQGGSGYESGLILTEIRDAPTQTKYIPVCLDGRYCLPSFLKGRYCLDISQESEYQKLLEAIRANAKNDTH